MDKGHWEYIGDFDPTEWFGFIYRIIDTTNNKEYIGKKQLFANTTKPPLKGKTRKRKITKESDWKRYCSSSVHIKEAIEKKGKENFIFLIESLHKTKASLHYAEVEQQVLEDVLRAKQENGERKYYNGMIANIKFLPPEEVSEETKQKIRNTLKICWLNTDHHYYNKMSDDEKQEWSKKYRIGDNCNLKRNKTEKEWREHIEKFFSGENNPMFGRTGEKHPLFNVPRSEETKQKISVALIGKMAGEKNPRFGKSPHENMSEDQLDILKQKLSKKMSGEGNPMYGKSSKEGKSSEEIKKINKKISESTTGIPKTEKAKENMRKPKGPQKIVICPHCNKSGGASNMKKYHFENCNYK